MFAKYFLFFFILFFPTNAPFVLAQQDPVIDEVHASELIRIPDSFYQLSDSVLRELGILDHLDPHQNSGLINQNEYYWIISEPYQEILSKISKSEKIDQMSHSEALMNLGITSEQEIRETIPRELVEIYYIGLDEVANSGDDEHFKSLMIMPNGTFAVRMYLNDGRMCLIQSVQDGAIHGILFDGSDDLAKPVKGSIIRSDRAIFNYVYDSVTGQPSFHKKK